MTFEGQTPNSASSNDRGERETPIQEQSLSASPPSANAEDEKIAKELEASLINTAGGINEAFLKLAENKENLQDPPSNDATNIDRVTQEINNWGKEQETREKADQAAAFNEWAQSSADLPIGIVNASKQPHPEPVADIPSGEQTPRNVSALQNETASSGTPGGVADTRPDKDNPYFQPPLAEQSRRILTGPTLTEADQFRMAEEAQRDQEDAVNNPPITEESTAPAASEQANSSHTTLDGEQSTPQARTQQEQRFGRIRRFFKRGREKDSHTKPMTTADVLRDPENKNILRSWRGMEPSSPGPARPPDPDRFVNHPITPLAQEQAFNDWINYTGDIAVPNEQKNSPAPREKTQNQTEVPSPLSSSQTTENSRGEHIEATAQTAPSTTLETASADSHPHDERVSKDDYSNRLKAAADDLQRFRAGLNGTGQAEPKPSEDEHTQRLSDAADDLEAFRKSLGPNYVDPADPEGIARQRAALEVQRRAAERNGNQTAGTPAASPEGQRPSGTESAPAASASVRPLEAYLTPMEEAIRRRGPDDPFPPVPDIDETTGKIRNPAELDAYYFNEHPAPAESTPPAADAARRTETADPAAPSDEGETAPAEESEADPGTHDDGQEHPEATTSAETRDISPSEFQKMIKTLQEQNKALSDKLAALAAQNETPSKRLDALGSPTESRPDQPQITLQELSAQVKKIVEQLNTPLQEGEDENEKNRQLMSTLLATLLFAMAQGVVSPVEAVKTTVKVKS